MSLQVLLQAILHAAVTTETINALDVSIFEDDAWKIKIFITGERPVLLVVSYWWAKNATGRLHRRHLGHVTAMGASNYKSLMVRFHLAAFGVSGSCCAAAASLSHSHSSVGHSSRLIGGWVKMYAVDWHQQFIFGDKIQWGKPIQSTATRMLVHSCTELYIFEAFIFIWSSWYGVWSPCGRLDCGH